VKLIIAIVNNEDSNVVASALTKEKFFVTKLSTTGGFLNVGNTTFLIGADEAEIPLVKETIKRFSKTRAHDAPSTGSFGTGLRPDGLPADTAVNVGGATVFVLGVESMDKY
jgi:uncharacterized protein YaaQ